MLLEIGAVARPHGVRGEVVVDLVTDRTERLVPGAVFDTSGGPLEVTAARRHQQRWLVRFAGVEDRTGAERLRGVVLRAAPIEDPEALWVHELIGAEAVVVADTDDRAGERAGQVVAVHANPAGDLLELDTGALVPERFVVGWGPPAVDGRRPVVLDPPAGLLEP